MPALPIEPGPMVRPPSMAEIVSNLASLNEIMAEMVQAAADHGWTDPEFVAIVRETLKDHSHAHGFTFQGG